MQHSIFLCDEFLAALRADDDGTANPLYVPAYSPQEIELAYSTITYDKVCHDTFIYNSLIAIGRI